MKEVKEGIKEEKEEKKKKGGVHQTCKEKPL